MTDSSDSSILHTTALSALPGESTVPASPYAPPESPLAAIIVEPEGSPFAHVEPRPRIWTALIAALVGIVVSPIVSTIVVLALVVVAASRQNSSVLMDPKKWLEDFVTTRVGLLVMVLPIQASVGGIALLGALFSPERFHRRLALVRGRYHFLAWIVFALSTPVVGFMTSIVFSFFLRDMKETLERIQHLFEGHTGPFVIVVAFLIAVVPGFCEEVLFRGYVQSRLIRRLPVAAAIIISAGAFSFAHFDPVHSLLVFPLGLWLGVVAWRAESIWPSVMGHVVNNATSLVLSQLATDSNELASGLVALAIAGMSGMCLMFSCVLLWAGPSRAGKGDEIRW